MAVPLAGFSIFAGLGGATGCWTAGLLDCWTAGLFICLRLWRKEWTGQHEPGWPRGQVFLCLGSWEVVKVVYMSQTDRGQRARPHVFVRHGLPCNFGSFGTRRRAEVEASAREERSDRPSEMPRAVKTGLNSQEQ
ncbi:hypothetical protein B0T24DRAFT_392833 [Lasiosphaeria ovina]|uniref:Uncharacterized protein n=1 Tax=Lasiosphaeria ovina TaxID=92902 RepID=A0AAE0JX29_9PEZI|nr:hypothetical protein B0T24DRAFT_392833 [Lasiosphaeria ovina]